MKEELSSRTKHLKILVNDAEASLDSDEHFRTDLKKEENGEQNNLDLQIELREIWLNLASKGDVDDSDIKAIHEMLHDFPKIDLDGLFKNNTNDVQRRTAMKILDRFIRSKKTFSDFEMQTEATEDH